MRYFFCILFSFTTQIIIAQSQNASHWADSVYKTLSDNERIAQLMVVRLSTYDSKTKAVTFFDDEVAGLIKKYNVGGICVFQGSPVKQATIINRLQAMAKTPVLMCIDAEWGVGMRLIDSVLPLPHQMMLGAMQDSSIVYQYGKIVARQCKRMGILVNYAPVVDINNNPNNPVINDRSFGEDKYKVASFGIQYMKGMQDEGVMACAKHFPGHGDVAVDSHFDLPVINKSLAQLNNLELYPFKEIFKAGIASAMIAHLYIPAIDNSPNRATSLSKKNVTNLLRNKLGYDGLTFTDALEMQGVKKFFPNGEAAVQSLIAGNDMLCLPGDVPLAVTKIKTAIQNKQLSWADIESHCKKVLRAKYNYGLSNPEPIRLDNLTDDLNSSVNAMKALVAENAITLLNKTNPDFFPLSQPGVVDKKDIAYIGIGINADNRFAKRMRKEFNADVFYFDYKQDESRVLSLLSGIKSRYKKVVIGVHDYNRTPSRNFGISTAAANFVTQLQRQTTAITFVFGNPYAIKNWCNAKNLVACYEDDDIVQNTAIDLLKGEMAYKGTLPVTVCAKYKYGSGWMASAASLPYANPEEVGLNALKLNAIDDIAREAIRQKATPGCVVLVAKEGKIVYHKAFGYYTYENKEPVTTESIYDVASVTKICATTLSLMKLFEEGKLNLKKKLSDYLPWVKHSNKSGLVIKNLLLHEARLVAYIPFYKELIDSNGFPYTQYFSPYLKDSFHILVANNLYMRNDWRDTLYKRILQSPLEPSHKYIYSDNDFIFLGKIVEALSGVSLAEYAEKIFYQPLGLANTGFQPRNHFTLSKIVPTERENQFRLQLLQGDVHDPGAALFGGVAGHAGLFSNARDLALIMQMLLNGGTFNEKQFLKKQTIELFSTYHSKISRRGYGFDKPEKDNFKRDEPYPCKSASALTFGHTGFTGTCVWADPKYNLIFIFLSNRIYPDGGSNRKLISLNIRSRINEAIYEAIEKDK